MARWPDIAMHMALSSWSTANKSTAPSEYEIKKFKPVDSVWLASRRAVKTSDRKWTNKMQMDFIKMVFADAKWKFLFTFSSGAAQLQTANAFFLLLLLVCLFV